LKCFFLKLSNLDEGILDEVKFRLAMCVARFQLVSLVEMLNVPINGLGLHNQVC